MGVGNLPGIRHSFEEHPVFCNQMTSRLLLEIVDEHRLGDSRKRNGHQNAHQTAHDAAQCAPKSIPHHHADDDQHGMDIDRISHDLRVDEHIDEALDDQSGHDHENRRHGIGEQADESDHRNAHPLAEHGKDVARRNHQCINGCIGESDKRESQAASYADHQALDRHALDEAAEHAGEGAPQKIEILDDLPPEQALQLAAHAGHLEQQPECGDKREHDAHECVHGEPGEADHVLRETGYRLLAIGDETAQRRFDPGHDGGIGEDLRVVAIEPFDIILDTGNGR